LHHHNRKEVEIFEERRKYMSRNRNRFEVLGLILALVAVAVLAGCKGGSSCERDFDDPAGGGGGGTGGGGASGTVPGNISIGLAENPEAPRIPGGTADEREVLRLINNERNAAGVGQLQWDDALADMGRSHAYDCNQLSYGGHGSSASPGSYLANERAKFLGLTNYSAYSGIVSENGSMRGGPEAVVSGWMQSSGHRMNVLYSGHTHAGVGYGGRYCFFENATKK
jgi:uncharacterized protein YkwD